MAHQEKSKNKIALLGHGIFTSATFKVISENFNVVARQDADCYVVANYGKILSKDELNNLKFGAINLHGSILPKYRGSSPVQTAIINNESRTGLTIIKMDEKIDHGPILKIIETKILSDDTTQDILSKLDALASRVIVDILNRIFTRNIKPIAQDHKNATYTNKITNPIIIPINANSNIIYLNYRAYSYEPGLFIKLQDNNLLKIIHAKYTNTFVPLIVQRPGKKPVSYNEFLNGYRGKEIIFTDKL